MRFSAALYASLVLIAACAAIASADGEAASPEASSKIRGMTVSCHSWGWEWGTDEMVQSMEKLKAMGVNWIAIHPYAGIRGNGRVVIKDDWYEDASWIKRPIEEAHRLGMKIFIKPHIAYWGSPFEWRGKIKFDTDEEWARFFKTYRQWIVEVARVSAGADGFSVGTELDQTVQHETAWREIIADIRKALDAPLTYSANWDMYQRVPFWDALDVIGIQSYFPLVNHDRMPDMKELEAGWKRLGRELDAFAGPRGKKVLLAELGYNRSATAAQLPWEYRTGGSDADEVQRRCMAAALRALPGDDTIVGAFLWKWFPGETGRGNFLMSTPAMRAVIEEHWKEEGE